MRLIDADNLLQQIEERIKESGKYRMAVLADELIDIVNDYAEDYENAEPVVKCKDCAFVDTLECPLNYIDKQRQIYTNRSPDWFCAEGVKKDET